TPGLGRAATVFRSRSAAAFASTAARSGPASPPTPAPTSAATDRTTVALPAPEGPETRPPSVMSVPTTVRTSRRLTPSPARAPTRGPRAQDSQRHVRAHHREHLSMVEAQVEQLPQRLGGDARAHELLVGDVLGLPRLGHAHGRLGPRGGPLPVRGRAAARLGP